MVSLWLLLIICFLGSFTAQAEPVLPAWSLEQVHKAIQSTTACIPYPTYQQREFWDHAGKLPLFREGVEKIQAEAKGLKSTDPPFLRASKYLDFQRNGDREQYQNLLSERARFLNAFSLAECFQGRGDYLDPLMDILWAYCEESDWCYPAHTKGLVNPPLPAIDLRSTRVSLDLAVADYVFNDALLPEVRQRIHYELQQRTFLPFLSREFGWMTSRHNWNAVCNGNIIRAALLVIEDRDQLAQIITRAQNSLEYFLEGFDQDGGTAEGIGYWNYGFSHFVQAGWFLNSCSRTAGQLDLFAPQLVKDIACFPMRAELSPGMYPSFSDGGEKIEFSFGWISAVAEACGLEDLKAFIQARKGPKGSVASLDGFLQEALLLKDAETAQPFLAEKSNFFSGIEWFISRADPAETDGLVIAAQGGNNGENHNHNDVGNMILHYKGESILADLGAPVYDRGFFSSRRYSYLAARSLGHSVPRVHGIEQIAGAQARAIAAVTRTDEVDTFRADITSAYPPAAGLKSLVRTIKLHRKPGDGWVEVRDDCSVSIPDATFESALITYGQIEIAKPGLVRIQGQHGAIEISYQPEEGTAASVQEFDSKAEKLRTAEAKPIVRRLALTRKAENEAAHLTLRIVPVSLSSH